MNFEIHILDYLIILLYLVGIFFLAFRSSRLNKSGNGLVNEQYLAGKSLTFFESFCSIIATEVSALTFLGIPAFAYASDFSFVQIYMGALVGRIIIAKIMLPLIYDKGLTVYSVMGQEGSPNGQRAIAIFYSLNKFLAVGVRLFSGSILISQFFDVSIYLAVGLICLITFFYTLVGGLKAVVRTDMVQMFLFIFGGLVAHYLIPEINNSSWYEMMSMANEAGKTSFFDFSNPLPFIIGVAGGILFDMATHGVDQDFVQRLTANKSLKSAQRAIISSTFLSIAIGFLFLGVGALLWSFYQTNTAPMIGNDQLFAHFITNYFPIGVKGLMVAGVLAATMSTLDSSINALSACLYKDIFRQDKKKTSSEITVKKMYQKDTLIITAGLMLIAFIASESDGLLLLGLKITSWTAGSLLAVFFLTLVFKSARLTPMNVIIAYIFGAAGVYLNSSILEWNWNFNVYFGFIFSIIAVTLFTKLTKKRPE